MADILSDLADTVRAVTNALEEQSPYYFHAFGDTDVQGWILWKMVLTILRRFEETGITQQELPRSIQRPGAAVGLAVGLAIRQAALANAQR